MGYIVTQTIGFLLVGGILAFGVFFLLCIVGVIKLPPGRGHGDGPGTADMGG